MEKVKTKFLIVGGGIIGLAILRQLSKNGDSILVDKNKFLGDEVSSRNSGVVHSGIYYQSGSLKSKLTYQGNRLIKDYCLKKGVFFLECGKLIIGTSKDHEKIHSLYKQGCKNGVKGLEILNGSAIRRMEPEISNNYDIAILSKHTGIFDVPSFIKNLENDSIDNGSYISLNTEFIGSSWNGDRHISKCKTNDEEFEIESEFIILAGGLNSYYLGKSSGLNKHNSVIRKLNLSKGHYFKLIGKSPFNKLIYPIPNEHSLGIHSRIDEANETIFGPDHEFIDEIDYTFSDNIKEKFVREIKKYWPNVSKRKLSPDYVGIRPKIQNKNEKFKDFDIEIDNEKKLIFLQGIESPGVTCNLSIARYIANKIYG